MKNQRKWKKSSWKRLTCPYLPAYSSQKSVRETLGILEKKQPLVDCCSIYDFKKNLIEAGKGEKFIFHAGDCVETFSNCNRSYLSKQIKLLAQANLLLKYFLKKEIICIARIAGQYAKPRSCMIETRKKHSLPAYLGDIINKHHFTEPARKPNPRLMLKAYECSKKTRSFINNSLPQMPSCKFNETDWGIGLPANMLLKHKSILTNEQENTLFCPSLNNLYTSHETLLLPYEEALTRKDKRTKLWYNTSTHFPWIGIRTLDLKSAHVEYLRGINNPIGIKLNYNFSPDSLIALLDILNPKNQNGKIVLISRFGAKKVNMLAKYIKTVKLHNKNVIWLCDPMHGNTETCLDQKKTRRLENVASELISTSTMHKNLGSRLAGIHLEVSGDDILECLSNNEKFAPNKYKSLIDPRLNAEQTLSLLTKFISNLEKIDEGST